MTEPFVRSDVRQFLDYLNNLPGSRGHEVGPEGVQFRARLLLLGARLRPILGSDIAHWDVRDMTDPVAEAYELVERGVIDQRAFRELTFVNPVRLHGGANPDFFAGSVCEAEAEAVLGEDR